MKSFVTAILVIMCAAGAASAFDAQITAECQAGLVALRVVVTDPEPPSFPHPDGYGGYTVVSVACGGRPSIMGTVERSIAGPSTPWRGAGPT